MQTVRHYINPLQSTPATFRYSKIERRASFPFDLSTMRDASEGKKRRKKPWTVPNLDDFLRFNPRGRFSSEPVQTPFPNPFQDSASLAAPLLLRTVLGNPAPAKAIQDPLLKHLKLLFCQKGRLLRNREGLYFVKLPDRMLTLALPFLKKHGGEIPPHFQLIDYLGAHIPAILPTEKIDFGVTPKEVGESFHFVITGLFEKEVDNFDGVKKIWYIAFTSYDLEWLRRKYGLTSSLGGESFHCIIGVQQGKKPFSPPPTFRISPIAQPA